MTVPHLAETEGNEPPIINFAGKLVALGPHRRELLPLYQRWINDFTAIRNLGGVPPGPMTLEAETRWFEGLVNAEHREVGFTIYELATMRPIGNTGLHGIDYRNKTAEFGILIGEQDARGRGFGTEVSRLMLDYAFTALGLNNVMLRVYAFNLAGIRTYEKAGFHEFGRRRESILLAGKLWDVIFMECLAREFTSPVLAKIFAPDPQRPIADNL